MMKGLDIYLLRNITFLLEVMSWILLCYKIVFVIPNK